MGAWTSGDDLGQCAAIVYRRSHSTRHEAPGISDRSVDSPAGVVVPVGNDGCCMRRGVLYIYRDEAAVGARRGGTASGCLLCVTCLAPLWTRCDFIENS